MARGRPTTEPGTYGEISYSCHGENKIMAGVRVRLRNGKTKRIRKVGKSKAEATRRIKAAITEATAVNDTQELRTNSTIKDLVAEYIRTHDGSPNTIDVYTSTAKNHINPRLGALRINELTPATVQGFLDEYKGREATGKRARAILSDAFAMATRYGLVETNPIRETKAPKTKGRKEIRIFENNEMEIFFKMVDHYHQQEKLGRKIRAEAFPQLVRFLAGTGIRLSEALSFRIDDIDLEANPPTAIVRPTKDSGNSTRKIQLPSIAVEAVKTQLRNTQDYGGWLFPTSTGTHVDKSSAGRWLREAREDWAASEKSRGCADVSWATFHTFRKTVATLLADRVSLQAASQQLGHADDTITQHHYWRRPKNGPEVAEIINEHLN